MTTTTLGEEIYRAMFENAGVGITRVDLKGALVDANQTFCNMVGYTRDKLLGRPLSEITHAEDYGEGADYRNQLTRGAMKSATGEKRFVHKDGSIIWVQRTMSIVTDDAGKPQYVISVVENISKRKQVERRQMVEHAVTLLLADAHSIAEAIPRVIQIMSETLGYAYGARWVLDPADRVLRCTESWCAAEPAVEEFCRKSTSSVETETPGKPGRRPPRSGSPMLRRKPR
jgi:PAS domain S-box-containing protein